MLKSWAATVWLPTPFQATQCRTPALWKSLCFLRALPLSATTASTSVKSSKKWWLTKVCWKSIQERLWAATRWANSTSLQLSNLSAHQHSTSRLLPNLLHLQVLPHLATTCSTLQSSPRCRLTLRSPLWVKVCLLVAQRSRPSLLTQKTKHSQCKTVCFSVPTSPPFTLIHKPTPAQAMPLLLQWP